MRKLGVRYLGVTPVNVGQMLETSYHPTKKQLVHPRGERFLHDIYDNLRGVAANLMRFESPGHSLQPTALVHEAFLRAQGRDGFSSLDTLAKKAVLSREMRRVLIDHARYKKADKRGGPRLTRVSLDQSIGALSTPWIEVFALEKALVRLEAQDAQTARIVELRFFGGFTEVEIGQFLGLARRTVQKRWAWARARLRDELEGSSKT